MLQLYSAQICPFAQRTRSILGYLQIPVKHVEIDLTDKPADFESISPTGKVPLLIDGDFKLYESQIINEYLAETHDWAAWSEDPRQRARERIAAKQWDEVVSAQFYKEMKSAQPPAVDSLSKVERELDELLATVSAADPGPHMLDFHVAPFWIRMDGLRELSPTIPALVDKRPKLKAWMVAAAALPEVQASSPDPATMLKVYREYAGRE